MSAPAQWIAAPLDYRGLRVTIMGLGSFGGGEGAARFFSDRGASVTVTDLKPANQLRPVLQRLADLRGIRYQVGRHDPRDFVEADLLVVSPAVPRDSPFLGRAVAAGVPLTSEMNLFWLHHRGRVVGITGSNGKSTTTTLTHALLRGGGINCRLGGNIGVSLLPDVDAIRSDEWVVLELSSFQLADLDHLQRGPAVAVVTNFTPNHLDRHASLAEYRAAKQTILRWQTPDGIAILNGDDPDVGHWPVSGRRYLFGAATRNPVAARVTASRVVATLDGRTCDVDLNDNVTLPGGHNALNASAAMLAALACGVDPQSIVAGVRTFPGLPHRLQFVAEIGRRRFYNDSKATTPHAALAALAAFDPRQRLILLAGGSDKGIDLTAFGATIAQRTAAVALLGETAPVLERAIQACTSTAPRVLRAASLTAAFQWAFEQSRPGDVVLLSPGCASYDWFANYEDRGDQFTALVRQLSIA